MRPPGLTSARCFSPCVGTVWDGICMMALAVCPEVVGKLGIPENHTLGYAIAFGAPAVQYQRPCSGVRHW